MGQGVPRRATPVSRDQVRLNDDLLTAARTLSRVASALVMLFGALALTGWITDVNALKSFAAGITMKTNAAIGLLLTGASVWVLATPSAPSWQRRVAEACALFAGLLGAATLSQHLVGWDLGIDQLLFTEEPGALATASPNRMGPPASSCFALAGFALLLLHERRAPNAAQIMSVTIGLAALFAIAGYAYGAESLYGIAIYTGISLHTAIALLALSFALLAASADRGFASIMVGDAAGSLMARRLISLAIVVPLFLGWLRLRFESAGVFDVRLGIAALILTIIIVFTIFITHTALELNRVEQQQLAAEAKVRDRLQEIETMMDVLPIGLLLARDRSARDIVANGVARELLRLEEPGDRSTRSGISRTLPPAYRVYHDGVELSPDELPLPRAARDGVETYNFELDILFEDGVRQSQLMSALPLLDEHGQARGAVASITDITARRAAAIERERLLASEQEARELAETASRAKDQFLATVSHELRTPLNAILGWASMLRDGVVSDEGTRHRALAAIERSCRTQAQLIDDILDMSRIAAGNLRVDSHPVDLVAVIAAAIEIVGPMAEARKLELRTAFDVPAAQVRGDAARLQQVILNLLANAVKFGREGGAIDIRLTTQASDALITVSDDGVGIDPDFLPYVFDRFRQADSKATRRHGGLGLGLAIARDLVEMHGGTLSAESDGIGHGATFTLTIPLLTHAPTVSIAASGAS